MNYLSSENIDYCCENCKNVSGAKKRISFSIVPKKIVIILKCYTQYVKLYNNIGLDSFKMKNVLYKPSSIINHSGNLHDGHYTTTIVHGEKSFLINDHRIVENNRIDPYIIIYSS